MYNISEESKRKYYESFNRTEKMVDEDVDTIKNWMKSQPHLPELMEDVKIKNFLQVNKFSVEKTKQKIDMYYTIRSVIPELFTKSNPKTEQVKEYFKKMNIFFSPIPSNVGDRILFVQTKESNGFDPVTAICVWFDIFEIRLYEDFMTSDIMIVDLTYATLADTQRCTPTMMSKFFFIYKKVYALRLKRFIFINSPSYISVLMSVLKAVLSPKIFGRVEVYKDDSVMKEIFPKESLPEDYGGDGPSLDELNENTFKKLLEYQDRFDKLDTLKVDESLRPEKLNNDEILGFYGNFKKLDVD